MIRANAVNSECLDVYQELKLGKKLKYIIYALNDGNTEIVVERKSESEGRITRAFADSFGPSSFLISMAVSICDEVKLFE